VRIPPTTPTPGRHNDVPNPAGLANDGNSPCDKNQKVTPANSVLDEITPASEGMFNTHTLIGVIYSNTEKNSAVSIHTVPPQCALAL